MEKPQAVAQKLSWFQDQKFGLFMHWGPYSQMGCIESWPVSREDGVWSHSEYRVDDMDAFERAYFAQNRTFNPVYFDPARWARLAARAGMRYVVFTTKHHDGFCMYDTKYTDYRVTHESCIFHKDARADLAKQVFDAFRAQGLGLGCYYSKADWHHPAYWDPALPHAIGRNPNYDTRERPQKWEEFVRFTHDQLRELQQGYGPFDLFFFDAGWVRAPEQDIRMGEIAAMLREISPGTILADRTVGGDYEDYETPEQEIPKEPLLTPWESCITMGHSWSYRPRDKYKSTGELIRMLLDVVATGGNLLLNIGPGPDGTLPRAAESRLRDLADWMEYSAEGIHGTRPLAPHRTADWAFTQKGDTGYAFYPLEEGEAPPRELTIPVQGFARAQALSGAATTSKACEGGLRARLSGAPCERWAMGFRLLRS